MASKLSAKEEQAGWESIRARRSCKDAGESTRVLPPSPSNTRNAFTADRARLLSSSRIDGREALSDCRTSCSLGLAHVSRTENP